jgi:hypothetical protein
VGGLVNVQFILCSLYILLGMAVIGRETEVQCVRTGVKKYILFYIGLEAQFAFGS